MIDYKSIDKRQWTCLNKEGDAGSGLICTNPEEPDVILKTSRRAQEASRDNIIKEFYAAKAVYDLGIPTPKVVEIVKIDDQFGHQLHATEALGSEWIPSMKEWMLQAVTSTLMIEGKGKEDLAAFLLG